MIENEVDPAKRQALISEALTIHKAEIGHIPLHQAGLAWGVRKGVSRRAAQRRQPGAALGEGGGLTRGRTMHRVSTARRRISEPPWDHSSSSACRRRSSWCSRRRWSSFALFRYVGDPVNNMVGQAASHRGSRGDAPRARARRSRHPPVRCVSSATRSPATSASPTGSACRSAGCSWSACRRRSSSASAPC